MSHSQLIILLIILVALYLLFKKADPYQDFKKWLDRNPQSKSKLTQETWDQFFIDPECKEIQIELWKMATFEHPTPDNLLPDNKIIVSIIRAYLREQKGITVNQTLVKK